MTAGAASRVDLGEVSLNVVSAGPVDGRLTILLHGFPEFSFGWRHQIEPLAEAGLHVVVPDQRGYNRSSKPDGIDAYHLDRLAADVVALASSYGQTSFRVVGHDWGGLVAWWVAARYPECVERLAILNAPHPDVFSAYARRHPTQALRSAYVGFFQLPWLPESALKLGNYAALRRALVSSSRRDTFSEPDLARYVEAWAQPGALTGMLNWYRGLRLPRTKASGPIRARTLILWGRQDQALEADLASESKRLCTDAEIRWFDRATHWVQHEEAVAVNAALIPFLTA